MATETPNESVGSTEFDSSKHFCSSVLVLNTNRNWHLSRVMKQKHGFHKKNHFSMDASLTVGPSLSNVFACSPGTTGLAREVVHFLTLLKLDCCTRGRFRGGGIDIAASSVIDDVSGVTELLADKLAEREGSISSEFTGGEEKKSLNFSKMISSCSCVMITTSLSCSSRSHRVYNDKRR